MAGYIVLAVIAFLLLLLCVPVHFCASYDGEVRASVRWLFIKYVILPQPEKEKKKTPEKAETAEKTEKKKDRKQSKPLPDILSEVNYYLREFQSGIKVIVKSVRIHRFSFLWKVSGEDAADCAIRYGRICGIIGTTISLTGDLFRADSVKIRVFPDFIAEEDETAVDTDIKAVPIGVLAGALIIAFKYIKKIITSRKRKQTVRKGECTA